MTQKLTLKDAYDKYGDVCLQFSSYYKFCFTFEAKLDESKTLVVDIGGDSDEIYRLEVCPGNNGSMLQFKNKYDFTPRNVMVYTSGSFNIVEEYRG